MCALPTFPDRALWPITGQRSDVLPGAKAHRAGHAVRRSNSSEPAPLCIPRGIQFPFHGSSAAAPPDCAISNRAAPPPPLSSLATCVVLRLRCPGTSFRNIDRIGRIESPIFIIHGTNDEVVLSPARPKSSSWLAKSGTWAGKVVLVLNYRLIYGSFLGAPACCRFRARPFWVTGAGHNNSTCTRCGSFFSPSSTYACSAAVLNPLPVESLLRDTTAFHDHIRYFLDSVVLSRYTIWVSWSEGEGKGPRLGVQVAHLCRYRAKAELPS